jgi:uncharacterized protein YyaL (SSP411 family)
MKIINNLCRLSLVTAIAGGMLGVSVFDAQAAAADTVSAPIQAKPMQSQALIQPRLDQARKVANFILRLQDRNGAIRDMPRGKRVNEDSNMEYALMGIAAFYQATGEAKYLKALEKGISWLAGRQVKKDKQWAGSWYYAYSASSPYRNIPTSPGDGVADVRGVDATGALFVYLLYLHKQITGSTAMTEKYAKHANAALNFVLTKNRCPDGGYRR